MHRGRYGRRVTPPQLTLDADSPYWIPFYLKPLGTIFSYAGFPIFGPLGAPYRPAFVVHAAAQVTYQYTWTDPVTGFTFQSYLIQEPRFSQPGLLFRVGINHLATGATISTVFQLGPAGSYWNIIGPTGLAHTWGPPTIITGLFAATATRFDWKAASWHEEPT